MTDTLAKLCYRNGTELDLHEQILMLVVIDNLLAYIRDPQTLECSMHRLRVRLIITPPKSITKFFYAFHDLLFN